MRLGSSTSLFQPVCAVVVGECEQAAAVGGGKCGNFGRGKRAV